MSKSETMFKLVKVGKMDPDLLNERHAEIMADFKQEWINNRHLHNQHHLSTISALLRLLLEKGVIY